MVTYKVTTQKAYTEMCKSFFEIFFNTKGQNLWIKKITYNKFKHNYFIYGDVKVWI